MAEPDRTDDVDAAGSEGTEPAIDVPRRSVGRNVVVLLTSQSITWILATVVVWIIPRYISPVGIGQLGIAGAVWALGTAAAELGSTTLLTVEVARDRPAAWSFALRVLRLRFVTWTIVFTVVVAIMWLGPYDTRTVETSAILGIGALGGLLAGTFGATLFGLQEMGATATVDVASKFVRTIATIGVLMIGGRVLAVASTWALIGIGSAFLLYRALRKHAVAPGRPARLAGRPLVRVSLTYFAAGATLIVYQQVDTIVMSLLVGEEPIGYYAAADILFGSLLFVPTIVMTAMFPAVAELHARDPDEVMPLLRRSLFPMLFLATMIGLGTVVVSASFVETLYGERYQPAGEVLAVFGIVIIPTCLTILLGQFAIAIDRTTLWTRLMLIAIAMSIALDVVLVPIARTRFDNAALAGAAAFVVTETFLVVAGFVLLAREAVDRHLVGQCIRLAVAGAAMLAVSWPLRDRFFVVPGAVGMVIFVVAVVGMRTLSDNEWQMVARARWAVRARLMRS